MIRGAVWMFYGLGKELAELAEKRLQNQFHIAIIHTLAYVRLIQGKEVTQTISRYLSRSGEGTPQGMSDIRDIFF